MRKLTRPIAIIVGILVIAAMLLGDLAYVMGAESVPTPGAATNPYRRGSWWDAAGERVQVAQRRGHSSTCCSAARRSQEPVVERPVRKPPAQRAAAAPKPTVGRRRGRHVLQFRRFDGGRPRQGT